MKIQELENKKVKIGKTSVTVKGDNGKTCGIVREIFTFKNLQPNKQIDFCAQIRKAGLMSGGLLDRVIVDGDKIYFLFDLKPIKFYNDFEKRAKAAGADFSSEQKHHNELLKIKEQAQANGITVIDCFIY
nr:MAG TPA: hypothetical protein [Caudoviricetes sp.]